MTSYSTPLAPHSLPLKMFPYVPGASKSKPKPKPKFEAKPMAGAESPATSKTAVHTRSALDFEDSGEQSRIEDELTMPHWNASFPNPQEATQASHSTGPADVVNGLDATPELERLEYHETGQQSLVREGKDHDTGVSTRNSGLNGPFDGSSLEFPLILESDAAEENHAGTQDKPGNGALGDQGTGYHAVACAEQDPIGQYGDLNAINMHVFSKGVIEDSRYEPLSEEDPLLFDVTTRSPRTRKRIHSLSDTIVSSAHAADVASGAEMGDSPLVKRQRLSHQQAECPILEHVPTPKPTPPPTPNSPDCRSIASHEPSPGPCDNGGQGGDFGSPVSSQDHVEAENSNGDTHERGMIEDLVHSRRQSSSFKETEADQYIGLNSDRREENREGRVGEYGECRDDGAGRLDKTPCRPSAKTSQRRKRTVLRTQERWRDPSQTALRRRDGTTMPTGPPRKVTTSTSRLSSAPRMDIVTRSCYPRISAPGANNRVDSNVDHGSRTNMSRQITDLTLYPVPKGSLIVAIVRNQDSECLLDPAVLGCEFLGKEGRVIRTTQLSPDSWILLGFRHDDTSRGPSVRKNSNVDWMNDLYADAHNQASNCLDGESDEESADEEEEEDKEKYNQRTHKRWLESDDARLLSYKDKQEMEWEEIYNRFPDRSESAVKQRYANLHKKRS